MASPFNFWRKVNFSSVKKQFAVEVLASDLYLYHNQITYVSSLITFITQFSLGMKSNLKTELYISC